MPSGMRTSVQLAVCLALAGLVACGTSKPKTKQVLDSAGSGSAVAAGSGSGSDAAAADPKLERAEKALTRIPQIKADLEAFRGLTFKTDVPAAYQPTAAFREFVSGEVARDLPKEKSDAIAAAALHIGLLTEAIDLAKMLGDAMVTQAGAYYDPRQKKFFVVMVPSDDSQLDGMSAHELHHALQDQYFDLGAYLEPKDGTQLSEDVGNARKFVVEGEATLTFFHFLVRAMKPELKTLNDSLGLLKFALGAAANMSLDDFKAQTKAQMAGMDEDMKAAMDAMDTIPPVILVPMMDSYLKGGLAVAQVYEAGGWDAVATLYTNPPASTEQMLHAPTKLYPKRDEPQAVTITLPAGYTSVYGNSIGELEWRVYFSLWPVEPKKLKKGEDFNARLWGEGAADGWDGDRFEVVKAADGTMVGLIATTWDDKKEAKQFADAYTDTIGKRFPNKERQVWVKTKGTNVYIVDGGTDAKLIDALIKATQVK
jgi:hypothetical protein